MKVSSKDGKRVFEFSVVERAAVARAVMLFDDMARYPEEFPDAVDARDKAKACQAKMPAVKVKPVAASKPAAEAKGK